MTATMTAANNIYVVAALFFSFLRFKTRLPANLQKPIVSRRVNPLGVYSP